MLTSTEKVKILHVETTTACNAACPQCGRELEIGFSKNDPVIHLSLSQIKKTFSEEFIKGLDKMFVCGNYGDPAAGKHTLSIMKYFRSVNPNITLGMNTNGSLRSVSWWQELAEILHKPEDYVVWSIDGLEDTNHIYRVNTRWSKILKNAQAFINAGGRAHWDMLVFAHNEHQVDSAEQLAKSLGFVCFRTKVSKRFSTAPIEFLNPPKTFTLAQSASGNINCHALETKSLYMSASGTVFPCCWLGMNKDFHLGVFDSIQQSWGTSNPNEICKRNCGTTETGTKFSDQWRYEIFFEK